MKIFSGDELGIVKQIDTKSKKVIDVFGSPSLDNEIINITKEIYPVNENDEEKTNLFVTEKRKIYEINWDSIIL